MRTLTGFAGLTLVACLALFSGCTDERDVEDFPALMSFLNAMGPLDSTHCFDILVDDRVVWQCMKQDSLGFGPGYESATGRHTVRVVRAGDPTRSVLFSAPVQLGIYRSYTCIMSGWMLENGEADPRSAVLVVQNDLHRNQGHVGLRTVNALWDSLTVQLHLADVDSIIFPVVGWHQSSDYVTVPPGEHQLQCVPERMGRRAGLITIPDSSDRSYTVYVMGGEKYMWPWFEVVPD